MSMVNLGIFERSQPLTIRTVRDDIHVIPQLQPGVGWVTDDIGIGWVDRNGASRFVPWSAVVELVQ